MLTSSQNPLVSRLLMNDRIWEKGPFCAKCIFLPLQPSYQTIVDGTHLTLMGAAVNTVFVHFWFLLAIQNHDVLPLCATDQPFCRFQLKLDIRATAASANC